MKKQLTAMLTAAIMALSTVPVFAAAEDPSLPDWVPQDYAAAVDFYNTHGATCVQDGWLCCIRMVPVNAQVSCEETRSEGFEPVARFEPVIKEQEPVDGKDKGYREAVVKHYDIDVSVYHPETPGDYEIVWENYRQEGEAPASTSRMTFTLAEDGTLTETDRLAWLPDCISEFDAFQEQNPTFSVHDGYIVYCGTMNGSLMFTNYIDQIGEGEVEKVADVNCGLRYVGDLPAGGGTPELSLYKPVKPGWVKMSRCQYCSWQRPEERILDSESECFVIGEDLSVTQTENAVGRLIGDCNNDGKVDLLDAVLLQRYLLGQAALPDADLADIDRNDTVDIFDLGRLKHTLLVCVPMTGTMLEYEVLQSEAIPDVEFDPAYREFTAERISSYEELQAIPDFKKASLTEALQSVTEETFREHEVLLVTSDWSSGNREFVVNNVERRGNDLTVYTTMNFHEKPTGDHTLFCLLLVIDRKELADVSEISVNNEYRYLYLTN